jgi:hypothetical protein
MECGLFICSDDAALDEALHGDAHAPVKGEFSANKHGNDDKEPYVSFNIVAESELHAGWRRREQANKANGNL